MLQILDKFEPIRCPFDWRAKLQRHMANSYFLDTLLKSKGVKGSLTHANRVFGRGGTPEG